jgi:hypothetical protein
MKRNFKFKIYQVLRNAGLLCKTTLPRRKGLRISRTIMPDGLVINHNGFVEKAPLNNESFLSELHVYHEIKNSVKYKKLKK